MLRTFSQVFIIAVVGLMNAYNMIDGTMALRGMRANHSLSGTRRSRCFTVPLLSSTIRPDFLHFQLGRGWLYAPAFSACGEFDALGLGVFSKVFRTSHQSKCRRPGSLDCRSLAVQRVGHCVMPFRAIEYISPRHDGLQRFSKAMLLWLVLQSSLVVAVMKNCYQLFVGIFYLLLCYQTNRTARSDY